jgi:hypothetical protein
MKKNPGDPVVECNPPLVILARVAFLVGIICSLGSGLLLLAGGMAHQPRQIELGLAGVAVAIGLFGWLRRRGRLAEIFASLDSLGSPGVADNEFARLVSEWDKIQQARGTTRFDAWELLRLRREIEARVSADPSLAGYWSDHQA